MIHVVQDMNTGLDKFGSFDRWWDLVHKPLSGNKKGYKKGARDGWMAALVYCRPKSSNSDSEIIARLNQENEKLKEALRHYADFNDEVSMYDFRGVSIARNTLREVAVDDICESKGW